MIHLRDRTDIIEFIEAHAPSGSIRGAMQTAKNVEFYGFFNWLPRVACPGWLVRIQRGAYVSYVSIVYRKDRPRPKVVELLIHREDIPWDKWDDNRIVCGDRPNIYQELKNAETERQRLFEDNRRARFTEKDDGPESNKTDSI